MPEHQNGARDGGADGEDRPCLTLLPMDEAAQAFKATELV